MREWQIISDGSFGTSGEAGCACLVHDGSSGKKINADLGELSSSDAELLGGLLGLSYILHQTVESAEKISVHWSCDSKTTIEGAQRVLQQNANRSRQASDFWLAFEYFANYFALSCSHLASKEGNRRQRACDKASRWAQKSGKRLLDEQGAGLIGRIAAYRPEDAWCLVDGRLLIAELREKTFTGETLQLSFDWLVSPLRN